MCKETCPQPAWCRAEFKDGASEKLDVGAHSHMFEVVRGMATGRAGVLNEVSCTVTGAYAFWGRSAPCKAVATGDAVDVGQGP